MSTRSSRLCTTPGASGAAVRRRYRGVHQRQGFVRRPIVCGRDEDCDWLAEPVEGKLTLRDGYRHQERLATERLAELLVVTNRPADAEPVNANLMRDLDPPDIEADELEQFVFRQYAFREECARAVFECCRLTGDLPGLRRAYGELREVLRALADDAGVPVGSEGTEPGPVT